LLDVAKLGLLAQLALADRTGLGVEQRDEAIRDRLAGQTLADLLDDLRAALRQRRQPLGAREDPGRPPPRLRLA
jgi:hypothetical protein